MCRLPGTTPPAMKGEFPLDNVWAESTSEDNHAYHSSCTQPRKEHEVSPHVAEISTCLQERTVVEAEDVA